MNGKAIAPIRKTTIRIEPIRLMILNVFSVSGSHLSSIVCSPAGTSKALST